MKQEHVNSGQLKPEVICSNLFFMCSDKAIESGVSETGTSHDPYIAVIPPGFFLTHEKFDKILAEYVRKGKPLSADDVIALFIQRKDH